MSTAFSLMFCSRRYARRAFDAAHFPAGEAGRARTSEQLLTALPRTAAWLAAAADGRRGSAEGPAAAASAATETAVSLPATMHTGGRTAGSKLGKQQLRGHKPVAPEVTAAAADSWQGAVRRGIVALISAELPADGSVGEPLPRRAATVPATHTHTHTLSQTSWKCRGSW